MKCEGEEKQMSRGVRKSNLSILTLSKNQTTKGGHAGKVHAHTLPAGKRLDTTLLSIMYGSSGNQQGGGGARIYLPLLNLFGKGQD